MEHQWKQDFVETNDIKLYYHRTGGNKTPIVLLHGITDNGLCWTRVARCLEKDFDVIMVDARGHGHSAVGKTDFSFELMADDVSVLIRELNLVSPILMGHSMGGQVATIVTAKYPELVSRLVLEDPAYFLKGFRKFLVKLILPVFLWSARKNGDKTVEQIEKMCKKRNPTWTDDEVQPWAVAQQEFGKNVQKGRLGKVNLSVTWHEIFPKVTCPALLIIPSNGVLTLKDAKTIQPSFGDARIAFIPNSGHSIRRE
nr:alpha/beta hydrolase [Candidatus Sigynarchaeota archaeon]